MPSIDALKLKLENEISSSKYSRKFHLNPILNDRALEVTPIRRRERRRRRRARRRTRRTRRVAIWDH